MRLNSIRISNVIIKNSRLCAYPVLPYLVVIEIDQTTIE